MTHTAALAAVLLAAATPVFAQSLGGELGIEYNAPLDGDDFGGTVYTGGLEYNFAQPVSISVNATGFDPDFSDENGTNVTVHGTYHLNSITSMGLFYARDEVDDLSLDTTGFEIGTEVYGGAVSGYLGRTDADGDSGTAFGADGKYALARGFTALAELDALSSDDIDLVNVALGAEYGIVNGPNFYAKLGHVNADNDTGSADETYVTIGVDVAFGPKRGTTFDHRSLFELFPSF